MANKLEKLPGVSGGGGGGGGGDDGGGDDGGGGGGLPPEGSTCRGDMYSAIAQLFPGQPIGSIGLENGKQIVTVGYPGVMQWWITGAECRNGYVQLTYTQAPNLYTRSD